MGTDAVLQDLEVKIDRGLDSREVERRRVRFGRNCLPPPPRRSIFQRVFEQLESPLVLTLIDAAAVSMIVAATTHGRLGGSVAERYGDAFAILLNRRAQRCVGSCTGTEGGKQRSLLSALCSLLSALGAMTVPKARVLRNGAVVDLHAEEVVPGDVLVLDAGDSVGLLIDESHAILL